MCFEYFFVEATSNPELLHFVSILNLMFLNGQEEELSLSDKLCAVFIFKGKTGTSKITTVT